MIAFLLFYLPVIAMAAVFWQWCFSFLFHFLCQEWYSLKFDGSKFEENEVQS